MSLGNEAGRLAGRAEEEFLAMTQHTVPLDLTQCLVLAHTDIGFAARASRQLRLLGWDVYLARTGAEARRLTEKLAPAVVVLDVGLADESGWLLCDKLNRDRSGRKVILIAAEPIPEHERLASFVGATALLGRQDDISALVNEVQDAAMPAAS
jgi:DNA-binding response OmpR family regulator